MEPMTFEERLSLLSDFIDRLANENLHATWMLIYSKEGELGERNMRNYHERVITNEGEKP